MCDALLYLIGLGLSRGDLPQRALGIIKRCTTYVEEYTSFVEEGYLKEIEKDSGKDIGRLSRGDLEEGAGQLVKEAEEHDVAVLVGGDPLMATTHKILYIEAKRRGVQVEVLHAGSIIAAAMGESGLDFYRFGRVTTIPEWSERYKPVSFYETIERNLANGMHSLVLLDYSESKKSSMDLKAAFEELEAAEAHYRKGVIGDGTKIIVMMDVGHVGGRRTFCTFAEAKKMNFGIGPALVIFPTKITDVEKEVMDSLYENMNEK